MAISLGSLTWSTSVNMQGLNTGLNEAESKFQTTASNMRRIGTKMTQFITLPLAAVGAAAGKASGDFEESMNTMAAVGDFAADETSSQFQAIREEALRLGRETEQSAQSAAEGFTSLLRRGFETEEALDSMGATVDLASAANTDLSKATETVASTLNSMGIATEDTKAVVDQMTTAVNNSGQNFDELSSGLQRTTGAAAQFGVPLREVNSALSVLADQGLKGRRAGTALRNTLTELVTKSEELGITVKNAQGELLPLTEIFQKINNSNVNIEEVFNKRALRAVRRLTGSSTENLGEMTVAMEEAGGAAAQAAEKMRQGLNFAIKQLKASLNTLAIAIGDAGFNEFATQAAKSVKSVVDSIAELNPKILKFASVFGGLAAVVGPVIVIFTTLASVISPVAVAIGGLIAGVAALITWWDKLKTVLGLEGVFSSIQSSFQSFLSSVQGSSALSTLTSQAKSFGSSVLNSVVSTFRSLATTIPQILRSISNIATSLWQRFGGKITAATKNALKGMETLVTTSLQAIATTFNIVANVLQGDWSKAWKNLKVMTRNLANSLLSVVQRSMQILAIIFGDIFERIKGFLMNTAPFEAINEAIRGILKSNVIKDLKSSFTDLVSSVKEISGTIVDLWNQMTSDVTTSTSGFMRDMRQIWGRIWDNFEVVLEMSVETIANLFGAFFDTLSGIINASSAALQGNWSGVWEAMKDTALDIFDRIKRQFKTFFTGLQQILKNVSLTLGIESLAAEIERNMNNDVPVVQPDNVVVEPKNISFDKKLNLGSQTATTTATSTGGGSTPTLPGDVSDRQKAAAEEIQATQPISIPTNIQQPQFGQGKIDKLTNKQKKLDIAANVVGISKVDALSTRLGVLKKKMSKAQKFTSKLKRAAERTGTKFATTLAKGIGKVIAGASNFGQVGKQLLMVLLNLAQRVGKIAIGIGVAVEGIKKALESLNPIAAIAAGVALIALTAAAKSALSNAAGNASSDGGGGSGQTAVGLASGGVTLSDGMAMLHKDEVVRDKKTDDSLFNKALNSNEKQEELRTEVSGEKLQIILDRRSRKNNIAGL